MSVQSWNAFFLNVSHGATPGEAYQSPPIAYPSNVTSNVKEHLAIQALIRAYQVTANCLVRKQ